MAYLNHYLMQNHTSNTVLNFRNTRLASVITEHSNSDGLEMYLSQIFH